MFTSLTLCSSSAISSIKYFYALVELSPQGRKYFISIYFPDTFIFHFPIKHKNTVPAAIALSAKTVFLVRLQGFEPWTPWLRVRCSTSWAKGAYSFVLFSVVKFCITLNASDIIYNSRLNVNRFFQKNQIFFYFIYFSFFSSFWDILLSVLLTSSADFRRRLKVLSKFLCS